MRKLLPAEAAARGRFAYVRGARFAAAIRLYSFCRALSVGVIVSAVFDSDKNRFFFRIIARYFKIIMECKAVARCHFIGLF